MKTIIHRDTGREALRCHVRADHLFSGIKPILAGFNLGPSQRSKGEGYGGEEGNEEGPR